MTKVSLKITYIKFHSNLPGVNELGEKHMDSPKISNLPMNVNYRKTSSISRTLVGNKIIDNSDVVGASPVGAAPTISSFST